MSNGNGQAPASPEPPESRIGGEIGEISKLLQAKAPEALESTKLDPLDQTAPAREPGAPAPPPPDDDETPPPAPEQTAAELAAELGQKAEKKDTHDAELDVEGLSVGQVAEKLGVDARKLYEDLRIPLREGRGSISLSELKQGYNDTAILDDQRETFQTERETWRNEVMVARQEMSTTVDILSQALVTEFGEAVAGQKLEQLYTHARGQTAAYKEREGQALLARYPDWKDDKVRATARGQMLEHLAPFGFAAVDLDNVLDHRLVAYVHANMERDRRITAARAKLERPAADGRQRAPAARQRAPSTGAQNLTRLTRTAAASGRREDQVPAISAIIAAGARKEN